MNTSKEKNIFGSSANRQQRKKRRTLAGFYGPVLMLFSLLIAAKGGKASLSFFGLVKAGTNDALWLRALVIYLYLLAFTLLIVYTYLGLEKLVKHRRHFLFFRILLVAIPLVAGALIYLVEPVWHLRHTVFVLGLAIFSVAGLLFMALAEGRKK